MLTVVSPSDWRAHDLLGGPACLACLASGSVAGVSLRGGLDLQRCLAPKHDFLDWRSDNTVANPLGQAYLSGRWVILFGERRERASI
jgi:hypothetical protein